MSDETNDQKPPKGGPKPPQPTQEEVLGHPFAEAYRYVGPGYVPGIPDQHLTSRDVVGIAPDVLREVHASPFYAPATDAELKGGE